MYDFITMPNRANTGSEKWNNMKKLNPHVPDDIVPLSIADMELSIAPEIIKGLQEYIAHTVPGYTGPTQNYLNAVCTWMTEHHHFHIEPEWIVPSPGVVPAIFNAVRAFSNEGDGVIVMSPVYYCFYRAIKKNNRKVVPSSILLKNGIYRMDYADLEKKASDAKNKILLLCSPHNPGGRVWTKEELQKLAAICQKHNVLVVADEIHSDIIMPGHTHTVFATLSDVIADNCLVCTAPSKTFNLAGLQVSNIIIKNGNLRQKFIEAGLATGYGNLNIFAYKACEIAYKKCSDWLTQFIALVNANKKLCVDFISTYIPQIKIIDMEGTYLQWWDCRNLGMSRKEREEFMTKKALLFMDEGYLFGPEGEGFERINLACPTMVLEKTLQRLQNALEQR